MSHTARKAFVGLPDLALFTTCLCWGLNFVITKSATGGSPEQFRIFVFNIIRFPVAAALLFATMWLRGEPIRLKKQHYTWAALLSFVGIFLYQLFYMIGQNLTQAANIGIVYGFTPLLILIISILAKIERSTIFTIIGVILGCFGLFIILFPGGRLTIDTGAFLMFIAIACWASYAVFGKRILEHYPPVTATAWTLLFGSIFQLPLALWQLPDQQWSALSPLNILIVIVSALFSLYIGYTLFFYAISRIGPSRAGVYANLTPVFTVFFASIIRHETVGMIHVLGLAVILAGIGLTKIPPRNRSERRAA